MTYTYKTLHTLGGTCDRCGKGIKNVVVLNDGAKDYEIGTDCAIKVLYMGGEITPAVKRTIDFALKAAKDLSKIQQLKASNELQTKFVVNDSGDKIYYWFNPSKTGYGWKWLGLACQNKEGLYKEIWDIVTTA